MDRRPICLKCKHLVWNGFLGQCAYVLEGMFEGVFKEALEFAESESEKHRIVVEQQQGIRFDKSLSDKLMITPYMVWRRKDKERYYEYAPKTPEECPFGFEHKATNH